MVDAKKSVSIGKMEVTMPISEWADVLDQVENHVVRVSTPEGSGTGFLIASSKKEGVVGIATALHVVSHAVEWGQPIRITHHASRKTVLLERANRSIHSNSKADSVLIRFVKEKLALPGEPIALIKPGKRIREGVELGWCSYPSVYPGKLCFFSGCVSAWLENEDAYLVDGVAINGVSGGPAFTSPLRIIGIVTAYIPGRTTRGPLPGVALIRSIMPYVYLFEKLKRKPPKPDIDSKVG